MNIFIKAGMTLALSILALSALAQSHKCASHDELEKSLFENPLRAERMALSEERIQKWIKTNKSGIPSKSAVIKIPIVFHVIYNTAIQNISDAQLMSQLEVMNKDFRKLNTDVLTSTHPFYGDVADAEIEFCLATRDPQGNSTTGITRTQTSVVTWTEPMYDNIKSTTNGGKDNWDPTKYLNFYVVVFDGTLLGFATFPDDLTVFPEKDGVVCRYEAVGTIGTAGTGGFSENNLGRTATHEVGHWLNLSHIWGDANCGDDFVPDTPTHEENNFGCPTFPFKANNTCGTGANGEMFMNYMDYVDDNCMNMFSNGQKVRMLATLNGDRSGLLISDGCASANGIDEVNISQFISVFPNPSNGVFTIRFDSSIAENSSVRIVDLVGAEVTNLGVVSNNSKTVNLTNIAEGIYYVQFTKGNKTAIKKIVIKK